MSQLDLAVAAEISTRHLSFIETGRAHPSQSMVLLLSEALDVPARERNLLLGSAGYACTPAEIDLDAPAMAATRDALEFLLAQHDPHGAFVFERDWTVRLANQSAEVILRQFVDPAALMPGRPVNLLRILFYEEYGFRRCVRNWPHVGRMMIHRLHRETMVSGGDPRLHALLHELLGAPGVPMSWSVPELEEPSDVLVPVHLANETQRLNLLFASTRFGSSADVTLSGLLMGTVFAA